MTSSSPSSNGATVDAAVVGSSANGNGAAAALERHELDACEAGQLEACASTQPRVADATTASTNGASSNGASSDAPTNTIQSAVVPGEADKKWLRLKRTGVFRRTVEIWSFIVVFAFKLWRASKKSSYPRSDRNPEAPGGIAPDAKSARMAALAVWLREQLVVLGPTFIKIGQQFSTRSDILGPEFIKELEQLQDRVPPFASDVALTTIEDELGMPWQDAFAQLDAEPIAAASLGQVHRAVIKNGPAAGTEVVVKVQRPGLKALFDVDTKNIRFVAQLLQKVDPKTDGAARDWVAIYDECCRILYQEIDYALEGQYADRFRQQFGEVGWIKVPTVYWDLTTEKVLTLEYSPGIKVSDKAALVAKGVDPAVVAKYNVECYLLQILTKGLFHADPHPGNIAVDATEPTDPKLIFYDFGMMGEIPGDIRVGLSDFFYAVYKNDVTACLDGLVRMGVLVPNSNADMTAIKRTGAFFLNSFKTRLREQREQKKRLEAIGTVDNGKDYEKEGKKEKRKRILSNIGQDLLVVANDQPFRFPALFTFVVRAFSVLDGIGKTLDPKFDISEISAPYARNLLLEQGSALPPQVRKFGDDLEERADRQWKAAKGLFTAPLRIERAEEILESLERGDVRLRVRALEAERAIERVAVMSSMTSSLVVAATSLNAGVVLNAVAAAGKATFTVKMCFALTVAFAFKTLGSFLKLKKLNKKELAITGRA